MKIAIFGTRGIPNNYGGFEQCAEYLSKGLVEKGFDVTVYSSHNHPYKEKEWNGVNIVHKYDPENKIGTAGQFIYDLNCIKDIRSKDFDIILQLGYTSSSIWGKFLPKSSIVTTNMDGLEWKRSKYSDKTRKFLLYAEELGVRYSDHLISDSIGIKDYLKEKYSASSTYIPYGAHVFNNPDTSFLGSYNLIPYNYDLLIARLEPENSIETILDGVVLANNERKILVVGSHTTTFGKYLIDKFKDYSNIIFLGGIYNIEALNNLRYYSNLYFHGHTVGGTNPSLLEAMSSSSFICANENIFNKAILKEEAIYFKDSSEVAKHLNTKFSSEFRDKIISKNIEKINNDFSWETIVDMYSNHFQEITKEESIVYSFSKERILKTERISLMKYFLFGSFTILKGLR